MGVESAWNAGYTGKGVFVAVVDDGVNMNHPDLRSNFVSTSTPKSYLISFAVIKAYLLRNPTGARL